MLAEILAYDKSALCRSASPALSFVDMQLSLLCAFLPSVALRTTNRHTVCFLCCLKSTSKWIRGYAVTIIEKIFTKWIHGYADTYVVTEYLRIHLFWGVALKWQGILQLSHRKFLIIGVAHSTNDVICRTICCDVIYHFFPINSQYLKTWGVESPACSS